MVDSTKLKTYFGDAAFWRDIARLALPIALQNLLSSSFSLVDTLMVGQLGDTPLAAVVEDALPPQAVRNIAPARSSEARICFFFFMVPSSPWFG